MIENRSPDALSFTPADVVRLANVDVGTATVDEAVVHLRTVARWEAEARMRRIATYNRLFEIGYEAIYRLASRPAEGLAVAEALAADASSREALFAESLREAIGAGKRGPSEASASAGARDYGPPAIVTMDEIASVAASLDAPQVVPAALRLMRPSLFLAPTPVPLDEVPLGASRLGGVPDLPATREWPRYGPAPLSFLAQIDLRDVQAAMPGAPLPPDGWLCFFFDVDASMGDDDPRRGRVIHVRADEVLTRHAFPADLYESLRFAPCRPAFLPDLTAPDTFEEPAGADAEVLVTLSAEDRDAISDLFTELVGSREMVPLHRTLGYPQCWQDPIMAREGQDPDDTILLLQLDTDERTRVPANDGFFWGSGGRLYFVIARSDLAAGAFDRAEAGMQYT